MNEDRIKRSEKIRGLIAACGLSVLHASIASGMGWSTLRSKINGSRPWFFDEVVTLGEALDHAAKTNENSKRKGVTTRVVINHVGLENVMLRGSLKAYRAAV